LNSGDPQLESRLVSSPEPIEYRNFLVTIFLFKWVSLHRYTTAREALEDELRRKERGIASGPRSGGVGVLLPRLATYRDAAGGKASDRQRLSSKQLFTGADAGTMDWWKELTNARSAADAVQISRKLAAMSTGASSTSAAAASSSNDNDSVLNFAHMMSSRRIGSLCVQLSGGAGSRVKQLLLANNSLDDAAAVKMCKMLHALTSLEVLDMTHNRLTKRGAAAMGDVIRKGGVPSLRHLALAGNSLLGNAGVEIICDSIKYSRPACGIVHLDLAGCGITDALAPEISSCLAASKSLAVVNLSWNRIQELGCKALGIGITNTSTCTRLDLSDSGFGDEGGTHIAEAIEHNHSITHLSLAGNQLGPDTCLVLAPALAKNKALREVVLDNNPLGDEGIVALLDALKNGRGSEEATAAAPMPRLSVKNCVFTQVEAVAGATYNPNNPNGWYVLDLERPAERNIAVELVKAAQVQGWDTWEKVKLRGVSIVPNDRGTCAQIQGWPDALPFSGELDLAFETTLKSPVDAEPLTDAQFDRLWRFTNYQGAPDDWRISLVENLVKVAFLTCAQTAEVMESLSWADMRVAAAVLMFPRVCDPQNLQVIEEKLLE
jgi:Leucine-rich repeat (LRR) protein